MISNEGILELGTILGFVWTHRALKVERKVIIRLRESMCRTVPWRLGIVDAIVYWWLSKLHLSHPSRQALAVMVRQVSTEYRLSSILCIVAGVMDVSP